MNSTLFGMGLPEIMAIAILTLLVFGPDRLPSLMRDFGRSVRKMREVYTTLAAEVQKELGPYAKEIDDATRDLRKDLDSIREVTNMGNLIPPITFLPEQGGDTAPPKLEPPAGPTIGGALMSPVNETPMSFPAFDPVPGQPDGAPPENTIAPPAPAAADPAIETPNPADTAIAPPPPPAAVTLSDDNPWKS